VIIVVDYRHGVESKPRLVVRRLVAVPGRDRTKTVAEVHLARACADDPKRVGQGLLGVVQRAVEVWRRRGVSGPLRAGVDETKQARAERFRRTARGCRVVGAIVVGGDGDKR